MAKKKTNKSDHLLKLINDKEYQLFELLARYHLSYIGNDHSSPQVIKHTVNLISHVFIRASIVLSD